MTNDNQSNPNLASAVASGLILRNKVDLLVSSGSPEITNAVADQAEANEVPCITAMTPWQPYFFGRHGIPDKGFTWTYYFAFGLEDIIGSFLALCKSVETNKVVGALFPNDIGGNAWADAKHGFPPALQEAGYKLIDTGRFQPLSDDYGSQISAFKHAGVEIVTGTLTTPDFTSFWNQAAQQGFKPKVVTIGTALLFPDSVATLRGPAVMHSHEILLLPSNPF